MVKRFWFFLIILTVAISSFGCSAKKESASAADSPTVADNSAAQPAPQAEEKSAPAEKTPEAISEDASGVDVKTPADANESSDPAEADDASAPPAPGRKWLVMLYQDADDEVLEEDIFTDFNEAELVGSSNDVTIVSQIDRYEGGFDGDGDWTDTRRYLLSQDDDMDHIKSEMVENMGELDSGNPQTLVDFANWAIENYPAEKYALILSDHGSGWLGGWSDNVPRPDSAFTLADIDNALQRITEDSGIKQFEFLGFDACLMSQVEALSAIAPYGKYAAASEEVEPSLGWAYAATFRSLVDNPDMSGKELAEAVVASYIEEDTRIVDDNARAKLVKDAFEVTDKVSAEEVAQEFGKDITMTAVDLSKMSDINGAINDLVIPLAKAEQKQVAKARSYAQSYESVFGEEEPPSYIDLGNFADLISEKIKDPEVGSAVEKLKETIGNTVIAEKHGDQRPGSTGFSIFFPVSQTYEWTVVPGAEVSYTDYAFRFTAASLWDEYLRFHYTGEDFSQAVADLEVLKPQTGVMVVPTTEPTAVEEPTQEGEPTEAGEPIKVEQPTPVEEPAQITAPGAGEFSIAPLKVSAQEIKNTEKVTLSTEIKGSNIAFVYIYTMYFDEKSQTFLTADIDFVDAGDTKKIGGVIYPDWGDDSIIPLEIDWDPTFYYMSDGNEANDQFALFEPKTYGVSSKEDVYTVRGKYLFKKSGNSRAAAMEFNGDGIMKRIITFTKEDGTGAPREVTPAIGDQFQITESWLEFAKNPDGEFVDHEGGTMTFGEKPLTWVPYFGSPGKYMIGIVVEDLDGKTVESWTDEISVIHE